MDSPKGGPLTTFIMMLPLIVVPTIAMLKPADSSGLVSSLLSAASGDRAAESQEKPADDDVFAVADEEFEALFGDASPPATSQFASENNSALMQEAIGPSENEPFSSDFGPPTQPQSGQSSPPAFSVHDADVVTQQLLNQLSAAGATRTVWFSPGENTHGFAAFFNVGPGIVSYRFEAIATTRAAAVQDVLRQFQMWQKAQKR